MNNIITETKNYKELAYTMILDLDNKLIDNLLYGRVKYRLQVMYGTMNMDLLELINKISKSNSPLGRLISFVELDKRYSKYGTLNIYYNRTMLREEFQDSIFNNDIDKFKFINDKIVVDWLNSIYESDEEMKLSVNYLMNQNYFNNLSRIDKSRLNMQITNISKFIKRRCCIGSDDSYFINSVLGEIIGIKLFDEYIDNLRYPGLSIKKFESGCPIGDFTNIMYTIEVTKETSDQIAHTDHFRLPMIKYNKKSE